MTSQAMAESKLQLIMYLYNYVITVKHMLLDCIVAAINYWLSLLCMYC